MRLRRRALAAAAALCLMLPACGGSSAITLESLVLDPEAHEGDEVTTVGTVVELTQDDGALERHLVIEDEDQHRVRLVPLRAAEPFIGADVEVTGRYTFDPARGRTLEVGEIREARAGS